MAKQKTKAVPPKGELYPKVDVAEGRDERGRVVRVGHVVRRPAYVGSMGVEVTTVTGKVERVYQRAGSDRVLVDFRAPQRFGHGLHTAEASRLRRSRASQG